MDLHLLLLLLCLSTLFHGRSSSLTIPLSKDPATNQYLATLPRGSPPTPTALALDLGAPALWLACPASSSARSVPSRSIHCVTAAAALSASGISAGACNLRAANRFLGLESKALLVEDTVAVIVAVHSCAPRFLLQGLARSAKGVLGLGRSQISLPAQIATERGSQRRFSVCLSSTAGVVVLDGGSLYSVFGSEIASALTYTPMVKIDGDHSPEYFINVKAIKVAGNRLDLDKSVLGLGARLSTVVPYTTLQSTILESLTAAFKTAAAAMGLKEVATVAPFPACYSSETRAVPEIELILQSEMVGWKMGGRNSMVKVSDEAVCLAFVDGGASPETAVVLGGYQMEDVVLDFDLETSMIGFSSSLLQRNRACSEFSPEITE